MFRIGEFSKMSKTTIKTLRYYDESGLLKPEKQIDLQNIGITRQSNYTACIVYRS